MKYTVYQLANMADVQSPDSRTSPGAVWLEQVADAYAEARDYAKAPLDTDGLVELADSTVPIYTYERWQVFVDLCAWNVDTTDLGTTDDMTTAAGWALYTVAETLLAALAEEEADAEPEEEADAEPEEEAQ